MRRYITIAFGLLLTAAATAQNLNPTVQVTNAYEGKLMEVEKQNIPMALPDSLTQFDWNFNYSVFDNPYKGAYEFNPYLIEMKPDPVPYDGKDLYLRAGAGYSLHPELQAVWSPNLKNGLKLSVYDSFKGYWGKYHALTGQNDQAADTILPFETIDGHDSCNRFGVSARYDFKPVILSFDGKFDWMDSKGLYNTGNDVLAESASLRARSNTAKSFLFDVGAGFNNLYSTSQWLALPYLYPILSSAYVRSEDMVAGHSGETGYNVDGSFSYKFSEPLKAGLSASFDHLLYKAETVNISSGLLNVTPSLTYSSDRLTVTAGMKFSDVFKGYVVDSSLLITDADGKPYYPMANYIGKKFFPQAHISVEAIEDALLIHADVTGGQRFNSYSDYLESNHFFSGLWMQQYPTSLGDASVNTVDVSLGLDGRIRSKLQFNLKGGFARWYNLPMESVTSMVFYSFVNMDLYYGELNTLWKSDRVDFSGLFRLQKSDFTRSAGAMSLPHFTGSADFAYNWNRRLFAGVSAEWATGRSSTPFVIPGAQVTDVHYQHRVPGWVDLGVNLEYRITGGMSLWLKGGNLLNQVVMRNLLVAEKGPYVTAGICLNL